MPTSSRRSRAWWAWSVTLLLCSAASLAHTAGVHKRTLVTVTRDRLEVLVTVDYDSGKRASALRQGADVNRNGRLSKEELTSLKKKLAALAQRGLRIEVSGYPLALSPLESKLNVRDDASVGEGALSIAVLLKGQLPGALIPGMVMEVMDESPDRSHVRVEVFQPSDLDGGAEQASGDLQPGQRLTVRLVASGPR